MHLARLLPPFATALLAAALPLSADPDLVIHTRLFALDPAATAAARLDPATSTPADPTPLQLLRAPATLRWGEATLKLKEATASWTPTNPLPPGVQRIADTSLAVSPTGHAVLRCIASPQYMEQLPEGTFALRQFEANAPDAPRYVLDFQVAKQDTAADELTVSCRPELGIPHRRAPLKGVQIPVGKPLIDVYSDELQFTARRGQWMALLIRPPAPFESGALALVKIDDAPPTPPSALGSPARKRDRTIDMVIAANRTASATEAVRPAPGLPIGYLLYDGGYGEYGEPIAGTKAPAAEPIRAAWQDALLHAGYLPASADLPPQLVLVYYWGVTRVGNNTHPSEPPSVAIPTLREKSFVAISAYDHADFAAGFRTLLWRVQAETRDAANLSEVLPALITASTSWLGQDQAGRSTARVQLATQRVVTQGPTENDPAAARTIDEDRVHALIEKDRRTITRRHYFAFSDDDREPRTPLPPANGKAPPQ